VRLVTSAVIPDGQGFVADSGAAGTLFASPATLAAFEENAGKTNSSTIRFESHAAFTVQRADAIVAIAGS
jgi:hypothetical protein